MKNLYEEENEINEVLEKEWKPLMGMRPKVLLKATKDPNVIDILIKTSDLSTANCARQILGLQVLQAAKKH